MSPGLYRVRVAETGEVVYIGQTGRSLRGRLGALCTCYRGEMPYRDPHTAAPTLWSLRDRDDIDFEVSVAVAEVSKEERLALEAAAITMHRAEHDRSPLANFGGRIPGYRLSTGNNSTLVAAGSRSRGGLDPSAAGSVSVPVPGPLDVGVTDDRWIGMDWTPWVSIDAALASGSTGLYRIRRVGDIDLLYVGQGRIGSRLVAHRAKRDRADHRQAAHFSGEVEVSWVELALTVRGLLEVENDAIASHWLNRGRPPLAQFLG